MSPLRLHLLLSLLLATTAAAAPITVDFLDVGQGDAALITSPAGKTVLIDAGPPESTAQLRRSLAELVRPIDMALLTHRHADHLGGLAAVAQSPGILQLLDSDYPHPTPLYAHLLTQLQMRQIPIRNATPGRTIDLGGGAHLQILAPPSPPLRGTRSDVNANSIIARLDYGQFSVLFCGDAEIDTERWLLASGQKLAARVVKVAHHGSRYSSMPAFVAAVKPEIAIVSVGRSNDYGHPAPETLARWQTIGATVYRTDVAGNIRLASDGTSITLTTLAPGESTLPDVNFVASRRSKVFHRASCPSSRKITERNRVSFSSRDEALAKQLRPAQDCYP